MQARVLTVNEVKDYLLAAILLVVAFGLMVQRSDGSLHTLRSISLVALSTLEQPVSFFRIYKQALQTNTALLQQNVQLQDELSRLRAVELENIELRRQLALSDTSSVSYKSIVIIGKELSGVNDGITIDAGRSDSVKIGMAVITSKGLLGRVTHTTANFSHVMVYTNSLFRVSAKIQRNQALGIVRWDETQPQYLIMDYVPQTIEVRIGDIVESSGASRFFPSGIPIGEVVAVEPVPGKEVSQIRIIPFESLHTSTQGMVILTRPNDELSQIKEEEKEKP